MRRMHGTDNNEYDQKQQRRHQHLERAAGDQANLRSRYKWRGLSKVHLWGLTAGRRDLPAGCETLGHCFSIRGNVR
jgi:hypothetical protein